MKSELAGGAPDQSSLVEEGNRSSIGDCRTIGISAKLFLPETTLPARIKARRVWVEEFLTQFAKPHWRVEASEFLPCPRPSRRTNATFAAAQRSNKQQTNIKQSCGEWLARDADLKHLIAQNDLLTIPRPGRHSHFFASLALDDDGGLVAGREFFGNFFGRVCSHKSFRPRSRSQYSKNSLGRSNLRNTIFSRENGCCECERRRSGAAQTTASNGCVNHNSAP